VADERRQEVEEVRQDRYADLGDLCGLLAIERQPKGGEWIARLARLDEALAARPGAVALRARASVLAMSEALTQHAAYFDAGALG